MTEAAIKPSENPSERKVGFLLGLGIFLLPYIFSWFVLRKGYSVLARVISFAWLGFVILIAIVGQGDGKTTTASPSGNAGASSVAADSSSTSTSASQTSTSGAAASNWNYSETKDEMRGATTYYAEIDSANELDFDFPYNGGSKSTLTIRKSPVHGTDVLIRINGQFTCNSYSEDHVSVKFDNGPIQKFSCGDPSDGSTGVLFIRNSPRFIDAVKTSDKVVIEAEFFQEGNRQMIFNTAGLSWNH